MAGDEETTKNVKRQRAGIMSYMNKIMEGELKRVLNLDAVENTEMEYLKVMKETLKCKLETIMELDKVIADGIEEDDDYAKVMEQSMDFEVKINLQLASIDTFVKEKGSIRTSNAIPSATTQTDVKVKLPTLIIKKFSGEPCEYQSFIESFTEAIDNNNNIPDIQKMNYLLGFLTGEAESLLRGFRLSGDNYKKALNLLKDRFGNPQILTSVHMNKLIELESVTNIHNLKRLRKLYDSVETEIRNLESLNLKHAEYGPLLIPILMNKLPNELKLILSREKQFDLQNILKTFKSELEAREKVSITTTGDFEEKNITAISLHTGGKMHTNSKQCIFCNRAHKEQNCQIVKKPFERKRILLIERRCFVCLKTGHNANNCKSNIKCFDCKGRHHVSICLSREKSEDKEKFRKVSTSECDQQESKDKFSGIAAGESETNTLNNNTSNHVFLQTATANVSNQNYSKKLRILFDLGSQLSYITPTAAKSLHLSPVDQRNVCIKTFGGHAESKKLNVFNVEIETREGAQSINLCCNDICHPLKNDCVFEISSLPEFNGLEIADKGLHCDTSLNVDILIGADHYWKLVENRSIKSSKGLVGTLTKLGYIFSGPVNDSKFESSSATLSVHALKCQACDTDMNQILKKFWEIEENVVGFNKETVLEKFENDIRFNKVEKRYEVRLPFIEKYEILNDNLLSSKRRMKSLLTKFKSNEELLHEYDTIIKEQLDHGVIELAPDSSIDGKTYYLPHRPVLRCDRVTTKVRMVFDASSTTYGPSLNECLHPGPSLTSSLYGTLLRFRAKKVGIIADLEKAFLQICLHNQDRDLVRFLWLKNVTDINYDDIECNELVTYRFCRVLFGATPSPFLLNATLQHHINKHDNETFRTMLLDSLHVDDLSTSLDNKEEAFEFYKNCKSHFANASLNMRKFQSNISELENEVKNAFEGNMEVIEDKCSKVLGVQWDKTDDSLVINFHDILEKVNFDSPTKRNVIQFASSIFDPLGLINPLVVKFKLLFQNICVLKLKWDECIPEKLLKVWQKLITDLRETKEIRFLRPYCSVTTDDEVISHELHGFSDASQDAYGCCIYLRSSFASGLSTTSLVTSKSRVAPLKKKTMPQLELLGAQLLSHLLSQVTSEIKNKILINTVYAWTDSTVVYCWLRNDDKVYKNFIQSRVFEIRQNEQVLWKLIDTDNNPADDITRGLLLSRLVSNERWSKGPSFLSGHESVWPELKPGDKFIFNEEVSASCLYTGIDKEFKNLSNDEKIARLSSDPDTKLIPVKMFHFVSEYNDDLLREENEGNFSDENKQVQTLNVENVNEPTLLAILDIGKFSSLTRLLRVTAIVIGFARKLKEKTKKKKEEEVNTSIINNNIMDGQEDMIMARRLWFLEVQKDFLDPQHDQMKRSLGVFTDTHGVYRCHGRIGNAPLPFDTKYPILLPKKHPYTALVVRHSHENVGHNKTRETLNNLRTTYWIPQGRSLVRSIINKCQLCRIFEGKKCAYPEQPILPKARVEQDFAFTNIGIDYAGPVHVRNTFGDDGTTHKAWIALITCSVSRAIYLDIAQNYDADALIELLERFFNRYGAPKKVVSDNGSNFTANATKAFAKSRFIRWSYNIEVAPWQGGLFERLIQSTKRILRKSLRKEIMTYNELLTLLKRIENILNNRPLTYVYDDEIGQPPLTPNHLIYGRKIETTVSNTEETDVDVLTCDRVKRALKYFWEQWRTEYLTSLRERTTKNNHNIVSTIDVGDVCLIEDQGPRITWKMGRIEQLVHGKDGKVRAAVVKTLNGQLRRPINKLVIIESNHDIDIDFSGITFVKNAQKENIS